MSDNRKYYYLKLKENYFDDDSIVLLESMQDGIFFAEIAAWSGATVILCISYYVRMHKYH